MRAMATDAILYCVTVGGEKRWSISFSVGQFGICVWRPLFRDAAPDLFFFVGLAGWHVLLRLYCLSC
jgi:hypothetical protein